VATRSQSPTASQHVCASSVEGRSAPISICAIVINYFGAAKTARCIQSLLGQSIDQLFLIDNSAAQSERDALLALAREINDQQPLQVVLNERNLGFGRAVNRAIVADIQASGGHTHYLLLNNDTEAHPDLVYTLRAALDANPRPALVSPHIRWGHSDVSAHWYQPWIGHVSPTSFPGSFPYLPGCCLLVDRALVQPTGKLFDEAFFMYGEDVELAHRARRLGLTSVCVDRVLVQHEGSGSSVHGGDFYERHTARAQILLATRLSNGRLQALTFFGGRAIYLGLRSVVRAIRFRRLAPIRAYANSWSSADIELNP
jgi:N-acetylglucosaminyl-diphospho-decaprenol L-rhamnosyltransferase